jgi:ankyrin repeat protein
MIKIFEKYLDSKSATNELVHLIEDDLNLEWEKNKDNDNYKAYSDSKFKKISIRKVKELINKGADINAHDKTNNHGSILCMAICRNDFDLIKFLVENGANVNDYNSCQSTPIYYASSEDIKILKFLIENKGDVNIPNNSGVLPIHHALFDNKYDNAILLLKSGSRLSCKKPHTNDYYTLNNWIKNKNYTFQKLVSEYNPDEFIKIDRHKIHSKLLNVYDRYITSTKFNL